MSCVRRLPAPPDSDRRAIERETDVGLRQLARMVNCVTVVLGMSKDPNAKLTVLLVSRGERQPTLVAKLATTELADHAVQREGEVLVALRARYGDTALAAAPRLLDQFLVHGRKAIVFTALPGTPMLATYNRRRHTADRASVERDFVAARSWLSSFQQATRAAADDKIPSCLGLPERILDRHGRHPSVESVVQRVRLAEERMDGIGRSVAVHGDYWYGNLLERRGEVTGVVDWEAAELVGDPMRDIVRFVLAYATYLDRRCTPGKLVPGHAGLRAGPWGAGLRYAVAGSGWFPDLFKGVLVDALSRFGASPTLWTDAVVRGLAEVAVTADDDDFSRRNIELLSELIAPMLAGSVR